MDEQYILLGKKNKTLLFLHTIGNSKQFNPSLSPMIFPALMSQNLILPDEQLIIFEFDKKTNYKRKVKVFHKNNGKFSCPGDLKVAKKVKDKFYVIKYNYELGRYHFEIVATPFAFKIQDLIPSKWNEERTYVITKSFE